MTRDSMKKTLIFVEIIFCFGAVASLFSLAFIIIVNDFYGYIVSGQWENLISIRMMWAVGGVLGLLGIYDLWMRQVQGPYLMRRRLFDIVFLLFGIFTTISIALKSNYEFWEAFFLLIVPLIATAHLVYLNRRYLLYAQ